MEMEDCLAFSVLAFGSGSGVCLEKNKTERDGWMGLIVLDEGGWLRSARDCILANQIKSALPRSQCISVMILFACIYDTIPKGNGNRN